MMKTFFIILGSIISVIIAGIAILFIRTYYLDFKRFRKVDSKIGPVIESIKAGREADLSEIERLAANLEYRNHLYARLKEIHMDDKFPKQYLNQLAFAESSLAFWLSHPNELQCVPDKLEFVQDVPKKTPDGEVVYFKLFRFLVNPPHWASKYGWMAGVTGPYLNEFEIIESGVGTWSELEPFDSKTPEEHVQKSFEMYLNFKGVVTDCQNDAH